MLHEEEQNTEVTYVQIKTLNVWQLSVIPQKDYKMQWKVLQLILKSMYTI